MSSNGETKNFSFSLYKILMDKSILIAEAFYISSFIIFNINKNYFIFFSFNLQYIFLFFIFLSQNRFFFPLFVKFSREKLERNIIFRNMIHRDVGLSRSKSVCILHRVVVFFCCLCVFFCVGFFLF